MWNRLRGPRHRATMAVAGRARCAPAGAADPGVEAGVRVGGGEGLDYHSLFVSWPSGWLQTHAVESWLPGDLVQAYWDLSVERWEGEDNNGGDNQTEVYIFGPVARVNWPSDRLYFLFGMQPSYMSHPHIDDDDMGGNIQFTSHGGLVFQVTPRLAVGLRGQHTSNSRLYKPNPGMNLASVTLAYRF